MGQRNTSNCLKLTLPSPKPAVASLGMDEILKVCFSHFVISSEFYFNGSFLPLPLCTFDVGIIELLQMRNNSANDTD